IPKSKIPEDFIYNALTSDTDLSSKANAKIVWLGGKPAINKYNKSKKGNSWQMMSFTFHDKKESFEIVLNDQEGEWLLHTLPLLAVANSKTFTFQELKLSFETNLENFELFWYSKPVNTLRDYGLLIL
ncbi:MAG: radical SAM protein, partial [Flavobacterium sp.]|nr:radical SAM protein [Flavobacterium sp.]